MPKLHDALRRFSSLTSQMIRRIIALTSFRLRSGP